jgi:RNA polymerase sigma-70 factor (ECF subfamily)
LRVLRALPQFEKREAKVSTWIFQIAVRLIQDQKKKPHRNFVSMTDDLGDARLDPEQSCARRRLLSRIELLVEELPPEQRMALVLIEFHGMSHAEVAQVMNVGPATVKTRLFRARAFLRQALAQGEEGGK